MRRNVNTAVWAVFALSATLPAYSHHSFAMFDVNKSVSYKGTVTAIEWTNPHVWLKLNAQENGTAVAYEFEGAAIAVLKRMHWMMDTVKPGDVVTVVIHPFKDGRTGGSMDHLILADGRQVGSGDALPGAIQVPGAQ